MVKYLEEKLEEKTRGKHNNILYAHWCYDKKVIPQALNAITSLFPHYSLHDETHSVSIVNNICRVLGLENIDRLSAIDIWLLLEASYWHDIGMAVTAQDIDDILNSEEFITYFQSLQLNKAHSLNGYANAFVVKNKKLEYVNNAYDTKVCDGIKFIFADYFRSKHASRSREIVLNPSERLGVNSPRAVIPPRLFKVLGDVCTSHTQNFEEVMNLPFVEAGIDIENAHPRFIACMLRLGDLLDLDNNRFSEVMLKTLTQIPLDTLKHKQKHLSFDRIRIDRDVIEITAYCKDDYETANITQAWLDYLNKEVSNQMIRWNTIVPSRDFGYLPTIGDLKVELGDYEYIDGKERPQFKVDTSKALELLQGTGLYKRKEQCLRELLQNAVDATLIRIWLEHGKSTLGNMTHHNRRNF
jgi:hypothetical protein